MKTFGGTEIEIPYEVTQAHEEGRLVFFCGAGISYYTGLPGFKDLVKLAYQGLSPKLNPNACDPKQWKTPHDAAFHGGRYDQALHLLEQDVGRSITRRKVIKILSRRLRPGSSHLGLHRSLLSLSLMEGGAGYRLVTTNFDDRFERAQRRLSPVQTAPALGPPRKPGWRHLTYLHGRIQADDPDGESLVLTSADFGAAYLRDGWAARFIVELLREFTVLFVGYSLNDPIVSYLVDALAAEMRPDGQFQKAYVLAGYRDGESDRDEETWKAKGVIPILFSKGSAGVDWSSQEALLTAWAREYEQGLSSRIATALHPTRQPYTAIVPNHEIRNVAWALSKQDASVAKAFADSDPSPHPSWLRPLAGATVPMFPGHEEVNLFAMPSPPSKRGHLEGHHTAPLAGRSAACVPYLPLAPITEHLGRWLAKHMADLDTIIPWVRDQQGVLHPYWQRSLRNELDTVPEPQRTFWRLLLEGKTLPPCDTGPLRSRLLKDAWPPDGDEILLRSSASWLSIEKPISLRTRDDYIESIRDLADFRIKIVDADILRRIFQLSGQVDVRQALARVVDPLTSRLLDVCRLAEMAEIDSVSRYSYLFVTLVGEAPERRTTATWEWILHLLAESIRCLSDRPESLTAVAHRWMMLATESHALFQRLFLFAASETNAIPLSRSVEYITRTRSVFWRLDVWPELSRFLRQRASEFDQNDLVSIFDAIESGPPADYRESGLEHDQIQTLRGERLGKLLQGGAVIPDRWRTLAGEFENAPERLIGEIKVGWVPARTANDILDSAPADAAMSISKEGGWHGGEVLADLFHKDRSLAFATVEHLIRIENLSPHVWGIGLEGLVEEEDPAIIAESLEKFLTLAEVHDQWLAQHAVHPLSSLMRSWAQRLPDGREDDLFLPLWMRLWDASVGNGASGIAGDEGLSTAINAPGGKLAQALLDRFFASRPKVRSKIPPNLAPLFLRSTVGESLSHRFARVVYASRLVYLFNVDPNWAEGAIIRRMQAVPADDADIIHVQALWESFLWYPQWNERLLEALMKPLMSILPVMQGRSENLVERLGFFIAGVWISGRPRWSDVLLREYFRHASPEALAYTAEAIAQYLEEAGDKAPVLWFKTIKPLINQYWPALRASQTRASSAAFARVALRSEIAFPDAVSTLLEKDLIIASESDDHGAIEDILIRFGSDDEQSRVRDLATAYPTAMLDLIHAAMGQGIAEWNRKAASDLLNTISNAAPQLVGTSKWGHLERVIARG